MLVRVTFSPEARLDLIEITEFLSDVASPRIARRYEVKINRVIQNLSDLPSIGSPRREFGDDVRVLIVDPYLASYEDASDLDEVFILRILHASRNITRSLLGSNE